MCTQFSDGVKPSMAYLPLTMSYDCCYNVHFSFIS